MNAFYAIVTFVVALIIAWVLANQMEDVSPAEKACMFVFLLPVTWCALVFIIEGSIFGYPNWRS